MFNVGGGEILVILVLALIVLGPDKLPNAARQAGKYLSEFRRMSTGFQQELRDAMDLPGASTPRPDPAPTLPPLDLPTPPVVDAVADHRRGAPAVPEPRGADVAEVASSTEASPVSSVTPVSPTPSTEPGADHRRPTVRRKGLIDVEGPPGSFS